MCPPPSRPRAESDATRTFVAVPLSDAQRASLGELTASLAARAGAVRWTANENLHVTLAFLGNVPRHAAPEVVGAVRDAVRGHAPFRLALRGVGAFPRAERPRVLWVGCGEGGAETTALHDDVAAALEPLGFPRDARPFTPHVTLGRVKGRDAPKLDLTAPELQGWEGGATAVEEVRLMGSVTRPEGARHFLLERCELAG